MEGQIYAVVRANSGVGKATAKLLAHAGATVVMVCRSRERAEEARREILASARSPSEPTISAGDTSNRCYLAAQPASWEALYLEAAWILS